MTMPAAPVSSNSRKAARLPSVSDAEIGAGLAAS